jgi:hypothetical protein
VVRFLTENDNFNFFKFGSNRISLSLNKNKPVSNISMLSKGYQSLWRNVAVSAEQYGVRVICGAKVTRVTRAGTLFLRGYSSSKYRYYVIYSCWYLLDPLSVSS